MNEVSRWSKPLALLALVAIACGSIKDSGAIALLSPLAPDLETVSLESENFQNIVQNIGSLCRRSNVQAGLAIHQRPTPNSPVVSTLGFNQEVTLAVNARNYRGPGGRTWIEITSPIRGFVSQGFPNNQTNLINCDLQDNLAVDNTVIDNNRLCRQVDRRAAPRGVVVRADVSTTSTRVGGALSGSRVLLVDNYRLIPDRNGERRNWVEIVAPVRGFISAGTLIMCR